LLLFLLLTHARRLQIASRNSSNSKGGKGSSQPLKAGNDLTPEGTCRDDIRSVMTTLQRKRSFGSRGTTHAEQRTADFRSDKLYGPEWQLYEDQRS
jgi:hypothetical protein